MITSMSRSDKSESIRRWPIGGMGWNILHSLRIRKEEDRR